MKNKQADLTKFRTDFNKKHGENAKEYYRVENVPPKLARTLMTGNPNIDPKETQNESPTMAKMIDYAEKFKGTLEGYVIPPESGRPDARITFDGIILSKMPKDRRTLNILLGADEKMKWGKGKRRFWWD